MTLHGHEPGEVVGEQYRLLSHFGDGPSSSVWKAKRLDDETRFCSLKFYNTGVETATAFLELLEREFDSFVMKNPHLVSPACMGRHEALVYTVSPYQEGRSLQSLLATHARSFVGKEARVLHLFQRVLKCVVWLHKLCHAHLDLTPSNLLLVQPDRVMMLDFGLNRILRNVVGLVGGPNNIVHTAYASPQRFERASGSAADDIFSIGVMLHEFATGEKPWGGRGGRDLLEGKGLPQLPAQQFSHHFTGLLAECLSENPADRPDAVHLGKRIQCLVNDAPHVVPRAAPGPVPIPNQDGAIPDDGCASPVDSDNVRRRDEMTELRQQLARERERAHEIAEKARVDLQAQLDAVRSKIALDAEAKIEAICRQNAVEAQQRIEAEKIRAEHEAAARFEIEKRRSEEEAQARIDAARRSSVEAVAVHIEQARRIVAQEIQARVEQELDTLHSNEQKRREEEEHRRAAEEEVLRQRQVEETLLAQRRQEENERTIRELKDILKAEIDARQRAECRLREMGGLRNAVEHEKEGREQQEAAHRVQLEAALQRDHEEHNTRKTAPSGRPSGARERLALLEWLKQSLREELEQDLLQSMRTALSGKTTLYPDTDGMLAEIESRFQRDPLIFLRQ